MKIGISKNKKILIVIVALVLLVSLFRIYTVFHNRSDGFGNDVSNCGADINTCDDIHSNAKDTVKQKSVTYNTEVECKKTTAKSCAYATCDYIPEGKTFEEVCGKDFKSGWTALSN